MRKFLKIAAIILASITSVALTYIVVRILLAQILPLKFFGIIAGASIILILFFILANIIKKSPLWLKITASVFEVAALVLCGFGIFYLERSMNFVSKITTASTTTEQVKDITNTPFIFLVSGIDTSGDIENVSRSDVNMLVVINPNVEKILIVNIPRDYYVEIDGTGQKDKLTHSGLYGIDTTIKTVEKFMEIKTNYYIRVNFDTVKEMVNIIGGLELDSDANFTAWTDKGCHFTIGINKVDGRCALAFARERKTYGTGDMHRVENQGQVTEKIIEKLTNPSFFASHYLEILNAAENNLQTSISGENLMKLINFELDETPNWQVERYALKEFEHYTYGGLYPDMLLWMGDPDWDTVKIAREKIQALMAEE